MLTSDPHHSPYHHPSASPPTPLPPLQQQEQQQQPLSFHHHHHHPSAITSQQYHFPKPPPPPAPVFVDNIPPPPPAHYQRHHPLHHHHQQHPQQHYRRDVPVIHPSQHHSPVSSLVNSSPGQQSLHSSPIMHSYPTTTVEQPQHPHHPHHQHNHHPYASPQSQTSSSMVSVVPSPPTSCPSSSTAIANLRYEIILEAPTAATQKVEEAPLTYLNKGQFYNVNLKDTESFEGDITSTIKITFHDESHRKVANNYWKFWMSQQKHGQARAVDIDTGRCSGVHNVETTYFDSITFQWSGKVGATISIRFNCLSTDFSRIKGVKGIPLRLHMESRLTNNNESSPPALESSYCRIKLFRDKGAERKNKDDARHIEKQLEKLRGKNGESHPLWLAFSQTQPYTVFCEMPASSPRVHHQAAPPQQDLAFARRLSDSGSSTHTAGRPPSSSSSHHPYLPPPPLSAGSFNGSATAGLKRPYHPHPLMTPPSTDPSVAAAAMAAVGAPAMSPGTPNPYFMHHPSMPPPPIPLDYDPTYVPQRRRRVAKLGIFAKFTNADDGLHRAVYLDELTVDDLKEKLTAKMDIDPMQITQVVRQVAKKENLVVRMDDTVVQDIPEMQDMTIDTKQNDDGTLTLMLCY